VAPTLSRWRFLHRRQDPGSAFDWSKVFANEVYGKMATVELQSGMLRNKDPLTGDSITTIPGTLNNAVFGLQLGNDQPVDLTVSGSYKDLDELREMFNAQWPLSLKDRVEARSTKTGSSSSPSRSRKTSLRYNLESPLAASNEEGAIHRLASGRRPDPETWFWSW